MSFRKCEAFHCLSFYGTNESMCCSHFINCCYRSRFCICFFLLLLLKYHLSLRKLCVSSYFKSSSSSPRAFYIFLQSSYYFLMTNKETSCCFSAPEKKMRCPAEVQLWHMPSFITRLLLKSKWPVITTDHQIFGVYWLTKFVTNKFFQQI